MTKIEILANEMGVDFCDYRDLVILEFEDYCEEEIVYCGETE